MKNKESFKREMQKKTKGLFFVALAGALSFTLMAFEWISYDVYVSKQDNLSAEVLDLEHLVEVKIEIEKPKKTQPTVKQKEFNPEKDQNVEIVDDFDEKKVKQTEAKVDKKAKDVVIDIIDDGEGDKYVEPLDEAIIFAEVMPEFIGGMDKMYKYLGNQLKTTQCFREMGVSQTMYVQFVVEKDGSISSIEIPRELGCGMDAMAKKVVSGMPNWRPGKQGGKTVRVRYTLPIKFKIK